MRFSVRSPPPVARPLTPIDSAACTARKAAGVSALSVAVPAIASVLVAAGTPIVRFSVRSPPPVARPLTPIDRAACTARKAAGVSALSVAVPAIASVPVAAGTPIVRFSVRSPPPVARPLTPIDSAACTARKAAGVSALSVAVPAIASVPVAAGTPIVRPSVRSPPPVARPLTPIDRAVCTARKAAGVSALSVTVPAMASAPVAAGTPIVRTSVRSPPPVARPLTLIDSAACTARKAAGVSALSVIVPAMASAPDAAGTSNVRDWVRSPPPVTSPVPVMVRAVKAWRIRSNASASAVRSSSVAWVSALASAVSRRCSLSGDMMV